MEKQSLSRRSLLGRRLGRPPYTTLRFAGRHGGDAAGEPREESSDLAGSSSKQMRAGASASGVRDGTWRDLKPASRLGHRGPLSRRGDSREGANLPTRHRLGIGNTSTCRSPFKIVRWPWEFDGVYENSEVWINGQYLGKRPYGFIGFCYDHDSPP